MAVENFKVDNLKRFGIDPPAATGASPSLGAHTAEILQAELGLSDDELAGLARDKVIGLPV